MTDHSNKQIVVAVTGASGVIYAKRFVELANEIGVRQILICSAHGLDLFKFELGQAAEGKPADDPRSWLDLPPSALENILPIAADSFDAGPASGSFHVDGMIIIPCSMKTLSAVANGFADNLITRCADVQLKERRPLVIVPREMPLSAIHLENMLKLSRAGATILPACPPFYHHPASITDLVDAVVYRALAQLNLHHPKAFHYST